jgi:membrane protein implicated in regulation of membrane protease activity
MYHLLLILPLLGLVLFFLLPWQVALPSYVAILAGSFGIYWKIMQAQRRRPVTGKGAMVGDQAIVIRVEGSDIEVNYQGESWSAISSQPLSPGQKVVIESVEGLVLKVRPLESADGNVAA